MPETTERSTITTMLHDTISLNIELQWAEHLLSSLNGPVPDGDTFSDESRDKAPISKTDYEEIKQEAASTAGKRVIRAIDRFVLAHTMTQRIVGTLRQKLKDTADAIADVYTTPGITTHNRQRQAEICRRDLCWIMYEIRHHNGGLLPGDLDQDWNQNSCSAFRFHRRLP